MDFMEVLMKFSVAVMLALTISFSAYAAPEKIWGQDDVRKVEYSCSEQNGTLHLITIGESEGQHQHMTEDGALTNDHNRDRPVMIFSFNLNSGWTLRYALAAQDESNPAYVRIRSRNHVSRFFSNPFKDTTAYIDLSIGISTQAPAEAEVVYRENPESPTLKIPMKCMTGLLQVR